MDNCSNPQPPPDAARQTDARRFAHLRRILSFVDYLLGGFLLLGLLFSGLSGRLVGNLDLPAEAGAAIYFLGLMAAYALITAPLDYITGYVLPRHYGLSKQSAAGWLADHLKSAGLGLALGSALVALAYWLFVVTPLWWLWGWIIVMCISLVLAVLAPVVILPLFFKTQPLAEGEVKTRLQELALKAGIKIKGIYMVEFGAKTTTANAAVMGVWGTRRIVLSDTLLDRYTPSEIDVIMAHEMGHQRHRDMLRLFFFQGLVLLLTFYVSSLLFRAGVDWFGFKSVSGAATLPLLIIIFGLMGLAASPLTASLTRKAESQADGYALELTGDADSFMSAMSRLTDQNLSEASPPRWVEVLLDDHPSYRQRLATATRYNSAHPAQTT